MVFNFMSMFQKLIRSYTVIKSQAMGIHENVEWAHGMGSWAPIMMGSWDGLMGWGRGMGLWAVNLMGSWDGLMGSKFNGLRIKSTLNVIKT